MASGKRSGPDSVSSAQAAAPGDVRSLSFLDQAFWKRFREADTPAAYAVAWLALQCRMITGVQRGLVVFGTPGTSDYAPVAHWPDGDRGTEGLADASDQAIAERRGVVRKQGSAAGMAAGELRYDFAYPFLIDDELHGVVAIEVIQGVEPNLQAVIRQLQWGSSWIESMIRRNRAAGEQVVRNRLTKAVELIATSLEHDDFRAACLAVATELSLRLDCDRVTVGFRQRGHTQVTTLSHSAHIDRRMDLVRDIGSAMDEALDQKAIVVCPESPAGDIRVVRAHEVLIKRHGSGSALTVPLSSGDDFFGALTFERAAETGFDAEEVELCECIAAVVGPILYVKRLNDRPLHSKAVDAARAQLIRLIGPGHLGRKLLMAALVALVAFFSVATGEFRVTAPALLEGTVRRVVVAPFEGYILSADIRAGDLVTAGQTLAALDDNDLALERLSWVAERSQYQREYDEAFAEGSRAKLNIIEAQIDQADAQIALLDAQLDRSQIVAPFDGIVVSGDLSQSIGASVGRGEQLFEVAPLDSYRVILEVDEREIAEIAQGQAGRLAMSSLPGEAVPFVVEKVTPISEARDGRNFFRVEGALGEAFDGTRLRPGMEGVGKVGVDERRLIWIWTYKIVDWARLWLWRWLP